MPRLRLWQKCTSITTKPSLCYIFGRFCIFWTFLEILIEILIGMYTKIIFGTFWSHFVKLVAYTQKRIYHILKLSSIILGRRLCFYGHQLHFLNILLHFWTFLEVFWTFWTHKCLKMYFHNNEAFTDIWFWIYKFNRMSKNVQKCPIMSNNVKKCNKMIKNVPEVP